MNKQNILKHQITFYSHKIRNKFTSCTRVNRLYVFENRFYHSPSYIVVYKQKVNKPSENCSSLFIDHTQTINVNESDRKVTNKKNNITPKMEFDAAM